MLDIYRRAAEQTLQELAVPFALEIDGQERHGSWSLFWKGYVAGSLPVPDEGEIFRGFGRPGPLAAFYGDEQISVDGRVYAIAPEVYSDQMKGFLKKAVQDSVASLVVIQSMLKGD